MVQIDSQWGYIQKTGQIALKPQFSFASDFFEGLAAVKVGNRYAYIDKMGKVVIEPQFDEAGAFSEGLARMRVDNKWRYISSKWAVFAIGQKLTVDLPRVAIALVHLNFVNLFV
ncbi:MAG TPA: WG repeat-containing protein [Allocoleopsis sp.]